jgi:molecular chaperone DnaK
LGTTNSVGAFKFAQVEVVTDAKGKSLTRSVVGLDNGEIVVGEKAYYQLKQDPENVIGSIKRIMGRGFSEPIVQQQCDHLSYKIKQSSQGTEDSLVVVLGGKEYEPEDISAEILKQVVKNAQLYQEKQGQEGKITEAVITIPAYFNDKQRYATQNAAKRAGLKVKELLSEPTAAAISHGFKPDSDDVKTILVYDFGGGTFDSSVISAAGDWFSELGKAGDLWLGGDDIDDKLIELVKQKVAQEEDLDDIDALIGKMPSIKQKRLIGSFKLAAEQAKIDLSNRTEANIEITEPLIDEFGALFFIKCAITRSEFEPMILPLVERSIKICKQAIEDANESKDGIDVVLMVGGSSQIPIVQQKVKEAFGEDKVLVHPRPMYAVAEGAAIVAAGLVEKSLTVSRNYCIKLADDPRFVLIKKGEDLPVKQSHIFKIEADGQRLIHFKFFSPDEVRNQLDHTSVDEPIGQMWLALDKHYPKGTEVTVLSEIDEQNEAVQMTAHLRNDESVKVSCSFGRGGEDDAISKKVEDLINQLNQEGELTAVGVEYVYETAGGIIQASNSMKGDDGRILEDRKRIAYERLKELSSLASDDHNLADLFISRFSFAIKHCNSLIPEEQQGRIKIIVANLEDAMNKDNLSGLQRFVEKAKQENENLPDLVKLMLLCRAGIDRAIQINPTAANAMTDKFARMLYAVEHNDMQEAQSLLRQLWPEVEKYLDQKVATGTVATGLTK